MDELRVVIADDDAGMRNIMKKIVGKVDGFTLMGEAEDGEAALAMVEKLKPHLVFLDVEMPKLTGIECAHAIQDMDPSTIIIFATAHDTYMGDAFEVYAFDYLVKPFKVERVLQTLERCRDRLLRQRVNPLETALKTETLRQVDGRMMLKHRNGIAFLDLKDILLVQREERATVIYTVNDGRYVTGDSLAEMEERLHNDAFFRCHKSYIVNLNAIRDISPYGRWTYVIRLEGTKHDALITHEKYEELEQMFR